MDCPLHGHGPNGMDTDMFESRELIREAGA